MKNLIMVAVFSPAYFGADTRGSANVSDQNLVAVVSNQTVGGNTI